MEIFKTISILILFLNNGMVKGNIIEEILIAVHQLQSKMEIVMNKVENIENTLAVDVKSLEQNINGLHEEVEKNAEKIYQKVESEFEKISEQNLNLLGVQVLFYFYDLKLSFCS